MAGVRPRLRPRGVVRGGSGSGHGQSGAGPGAGRQGGDRSGAGCGSAAYRPEYAGHPAGDERRSVANLSQCAPVSKRKARHCCRAFVRLGVISRLR